jgi:hypothetical protein
LANNAKLPPPQPKTTYQALWLHGERDAKALAQLPVFQEQLKSIVCRLQELVPPQNADCKPATSGAAPSGPMLIGPAAAAIPALVQTAFGIFELFRTSVKITSANVQPDEAAFTAMVAGELRVLKTVVNGPIYYTASFPLPILEQSPILINVVTLRQLLEGLSAQIKVLQDQQSNDVDAKSKYEGQVADLEGQIKTLSDRIDRLDDRIAWTEERQRQHWQDLRRHAAEEKAAAEKDLQKLKSSPPQPSGAADKLKQAKDVFDKASAFQSSLFDKNGDDTLLSTILRLESLSAKWKTCTAEVKCAVLQLTVHAAGAEMKTNQNYFATRESIGGGAVVSYLLYEPATGSIIQSGGDRDFRSLE